MMKVFRLLCGSSILWIWLLDVLMLVRGLDLESCRNELGMQTGEIPDEAITASSTYEAESVGPANARIRTETNGGAWCPRQQISKDVYEYLEIDMGKVKVITMVETQGRFGHGQGQEYADQYLLEYQREDGGTWFRFRNRRDQEVITGNTNTYIAELREIDPPIIAKRVRFIPYSSRPKSVCMRVEMYGCEWPDAVIAYNMPQGEQRGSEVDLYDYTYDGSITNSYLSGGLGQLTDGEQGQSNFRLDPMGLRIRGYEWIGWKNETFGSNPVEIIFKFDTVRNFTNLRIYSNNMFTKEVRVFKEARIWFSVGGKYFTGEPIVFPYMRDTLMEYLRPVIIPLDNGVGQYIKVAMYFDARWLMISEVQFQSEPAVGNITEETAPPPTTLPPVIPNAQTSPGTRPLLDIEIIDVVPDGKGSTNYNNTKPFKVDPDNKDSPHLPRATQGPGEVHRDVTVGMEGERTSENLDDEYIGIIIGTLAALILLLFGIVFFIFVRHRRNKHSHSHRTMKPMEAQNAAVDLGDVRGATNGKVLNGNMYNFVATSDGDSENEGFAVKSPSAEMLGTQPMALYHGTNPYRIQPAAHAMIPVAHSEPYSTTEITGMLSIQGVSGNNIYAVPGNLDFLWAEELSVMEFPREKLRSIMKLGEGQFGEVHLCEASGLPDMIGDDFLVNRTDCRTFMVAVKMLRKNASENARADFQKEVKILSKLKDPNIVRVLGVCTREEPLSVVVEYMKYGDLHQFLHNHVLEGTNVGTTSKRHKPMPQISYGGLIYMSSQIASGMKYLESLNMVHRDLATRNCLVGNLYTIKISDFGMSRSLYSSDYYRIEGKAVLPIRWMAWESVLLGKFSCKSDVWSFGVTVWEIMNFAREQPHDEMSDEQVIENCGHFYHADNTEKYPPQPLQCPREIYDLMFECWNRDENLRPTFREIHMFLQRKNMGYNPLEDRQRVGGPSMATLGPRSKSSSTNLV